MSERNVKHLLKALIAASPLLVTGCVPNESSIHLLNAFPYQSAQSNGACQAQTVGIAGGTLDISGNTAYILQWSTESTFELLSNNIAGEPAFQGPQRNDWISNAIYFSYSTVPALSPPLADELVPFTWRIPAGSSSSGFIGMQMITATVAQRLISTVRPGDVVQLTVSFYLRGELASGQKINTNKVSYTIWVYNTGFGGCRAGDKRVQSGPCGYVGGQDGSLVACCRDFTTPPNGC